MDQHATNATGLPDGPSPAGAGCLALLGAPFVAAGIAMCVGIASPNAERAMPRSVVVGGGVAVLLLGLAIILAAAIGLRSALRIASLRREHPDEPWRWRVDWAAGRADAETSRGPWVLLVLAVIWNTAAAAGVVGAWLPGPGVVVPIMARILAGGLLPAIGIVVLVLAIRRVIQVARFGRPPLRLETLPAWLGEDLRAQLTVPMRLDDQPRFIARLCCLRRERSGGVKGHRSMDATVWSKEADAVVSDETDAIGACRIAIVIGPVSADQPTDAMNSIRWELEVRGRGSRAIAFTERYAVPVFARPIAP